MDAETRYALADVMSRYGSGLDDSDMGRYRSCFADDVEVVGMGPEPISGIDNWLNFVNQAMAGYSATQHFMGPQLVEIQGDVAKVRTDVQASHWFKDDPESMLVLWATYFTDMVQVAGEWKIKRHELVRRGIKKT